MGGGHCVCCVHCLHNVHCGVCGWGKRVGLVGCRGQWGVARDEILHCTTMHSNGFINAQNSGVSITNYTHMLSASKRSNAAHRE